MSIGKVVTVDVELDTSAAMAELATMKEQVAELIADVAQLAPALQTLRGMLPDEPTQAAVVADLQTQLRRLCEQHDEACHTIIRMHAAAVGEVRGPTRGVVEDVEDLRARCDQLTATLDAVLRTFVHRGHPGYPAHQSSWIPDTTLNQWRQVLNATTAPAGGPAASVDQAHGRTAHGYTTHGHPCCKQAPTGRPGPVARCGGPGICTACATHAAAIHNRATNGSPQQP